MFCYCINVVFLSLFIPNHNQSDYLWTNLTNLAPLFKKSNSEYEIFISDNNSNDDFDWNKFSIACGDNVQLIHQNTNIGLHGQIKMASQHTNGKYVWLIGAGDIINVNILPKILNILKNTKPNFVLLNGSHVEKLDHKFKSYLDVRDGKDRIFSEYFGGLIYERKFLKSLIQDFNYLIPDAWPHVEIALKAASNSNLCVLDLHGESFGIIRAETDWHVDRKLWILRCLELLSIVYSYAKMKRFSYKNLNKRFFKILIDIPKILELEFKIVSKKNYSWIPIFIKIKMPLILKLLFLISLVSYTLLLLIKKLLPAWRVSS